MSFINILGPMIFLGNLEIVIEPLISITNVPLLNKMSVQPFLSSHPPRGREHQRGVLPSSF